MSFDPSEKPRRAAETRSWFQKIRILMGSDRAAKKVINVGVATDIVDRLDEYTRRQAPTRPTTIEGDDDLTIVDKCRRVRYATRAPSNEDRDYVDVFGAWRYSVFLNEAENASRVEQLLYAYRILSPLVSEFPAHEAQIRDLRIFLASEWNIRFEKVPDISDARVIAARAAVDFEALPKVLRDMDDFAVTTPRKRGGDPSRIASGGYTPNPDDFKDD